MFAVELIAIGQGLDEDYCVGAACNWFSKVAPEPLSLEVRGMIGPTVSLIKTAAEKVMLNAKMKSRDEDEVKPVKEEAISVLALSLKPVKEESMFIWQQETLRQP